MAFGIAGVVPAELALADSPSTPLAAVVDGTLVIQGTRGDDVITIGVGSDATQFRVDFAGAAAPQTFDRASFGAISVSLGRGDDHFSVDPQGQFNDHPLTVIGWQR